MMQTGRAALGLVVVLVLGAMLLVGWSGGNNGQPVIVRQDGAFKGSGDEINFTGSAVSSVSQDGNAVKVTIAGGAPGAHASTHLPGGADALATASPTATFAANAEGTAASFARSDHVHKGQVRVMRSSGYFGDFAILNFSGGDLGPFSAAADTVTVSYGTPNHASSHRPDGYDALPTASPTGTWQASALGVSTSFARADHEHKTNMRIQRSGSYFADGSVLNFQGGGIGSFSLAGDTISVSYGNSNHSASHQPDGYDALPTASPTGTFQSSLLGTSTSLARADHQHQTFVRLQSAGGYAGDVSILNFRGANVGEVSVSGVTGNVSVGTPNHATSHRPDGYDALPTASPTGTFSLASEGGVSTSFARADHRHQTFSRVQRSGSYFGDFAVLNFQGGDLGGFSAAGDTVSVSYGTPNHATSHRPDGYDALPTASPTGTFAATSAAGTSTSLARADHAHQTFFRVQRGGGYVGDVDTINFPSADVTAVTVSGTVATVDIASSTFSGDLNDTTQKYLNNTGTYAADGTGSTAVEVRDTNGFVVANAGNTNRVTHTASAANEETIDGAVLITGNVTTTSRVSAPQARTTIGYSGGYSALIVGTDNADRDDVGVTCDYVVLTSALTTGDAAADMITARNVSLTAKIDAAVGANGPDQSGLDTASRWLFIHIISNGTTPAVLISPSRGRPNLPSGYTFWRRVASVRNNALANFVIGKTYNDMTTWFESIGTFSVLAAGTATTFTEVNATAVAPPDARHLVLYVELQGDGTSAARDAAFRESGTTYSFADSNAVGGVLAITRNGYRATVACNGNQTFDYRLANAAGGASLNLFVTAYVEQL